MALKTNQKTIIPYVRNTYPTSKYRQYFFVFLIPERIFNFNKVHQINSQPHGTGDCGSGL
jgi:hypothetical protein